jgi:hypothetical protein
MNHNWYEFESSGGPFGMKDPYLALMMYMEYGTYISFILIFERFTS